MRFKLQLHLFQSELLLSLLEVHNKPLRTIQWTSQTCLSEFKVQVMLNAGCEL